MSQDFDYVAQLVNGFFSQRKVGRSLQLIEEYEITGWEVWFQVEFARFLSQHESGPVWKREWSIDYDHRMEKARNFCRPDFIIRKKGWRNESYMIVEVKQHPDAGNCFSSMMKDVKKISMIKKSSLVVRGYIFLGIHKRRKKSDLRKLIIFRLEAAKINLPEDSVLVRYIPGSNYAYSMLLAGTKQSAP